MDDEKRFDEKERTMSELKKSAQSVQDALERNGLQCEVIEFPASTRTAVEAAAAIGCEVGQIAKSLIFKTKESGNRFW